MSEESSGRNLERTDRVPQVKAPAFRLSKKQDFLTWKYTMTLHYKSDSETEKIFSGTVGYNARANRTEKEEFLRLENRMKLDLLRSVSSKFGNKLIVLDRWMDQWKLVEKLALGDKAAQLQVLTNKLHTLTWSKLDKVVDTFRETVASYKTYGGKMSDTQLAEYLLRVLPPTYDAYVLQLRHHAALHAEGEFELEKLISDLQLGAAQLTRGTKGQSGTTREKRAQKSMHKTKPVEKKKGVKCWTCGQTGHTKRECPQVKNKRETAQKAKLETGTEDLMETPVSGSMMATLINNQQGGGFVIDSGSTVNMCNNRQWFTDFAPQTAYISTAGVGQQMISQGVGVVEVQLDNGRWLKLQDCHYVPKGENLLSLHKMIQKGARVEFGGSSANVYHRGTHFYTAFVKDGLWYMRVRRGRQRKALLVPRQTQRLLWHHRLGHCGHNALSKSPQATVGVPMKFPSEDMHCIGCLEGRMTERPMPRRSGSSPAKLPCEKLHLDLAGPFPVRSVFHEVGYCMVTDDKTKFRWILLYKKKSDVPGKIVDLLMQIKVQFRAKIRRLHSDQGTEFTNDTINNFCSQHGIVQEFSHVGTPQQNGVSERTIRSVGEGRDTFLASARLPPSF